MVSEGEAPRFFSLSAEHVAPAERIDYWNAVAGSRMVCRPEDPEGPPILASVNGLAHDDLDLLDYRADGFLMDRTAAMCRADGRDEISLGLVAGPLIRAEQCGQQIFLGFGALYAIDFGRPVHSLVANHHQIAIALPRTAVAEILGSRVDDLAGRALPQTPISRLLAAHMVATMHEAARLSPSERQVALVAARDLALATLRSAFDRPMEPEAFVCGLHAAAGALIEGHCDDHDLNPEKLAQLMGLSRASLYRIFARQGERVAEAIWEARLQRAHRLLVGAAAGQTIAVSEVGYRSGFLDPASFGRMFRRRFGVSPSEMRRSIQS